MPEVAIWIQTAAISLSAIAAFFMILSSKKQSKKRATVEILLKMRLDSDYIQHRNEFRKLIDDEDNLAKFASKAHNNSDSTMLIFRILNYHEYLATGIAEDAFDEEIYKRMAFALCMKDWKRLKGFVSEFREIENVHTLYQEFESMIERWKKNPLKTKK